MDEWYRMSSADVVTALGSNVANGLDDAQVARLREQYGPNELVERGLKSPWKILMEQLTGIMIIILLVSAAISVILGEYTDAIVILVIVVLNAALGFSQEYKAEQAMAALKRMAVPKVKVRRGGHLQERPARELVPGDIIQLDAGDSVPADARLVESVNLRLQEAVLTGESEPVEKTAEPLEGEHVSLGDQRNMAFMGTVATYGRGLAVVVSTGMNTQLGRIAEMIQTVGQEKTPLQKKVEQLGKGLAVAALVIVAVVFGIGVLRGEDIRIMFQTAISMAVAVIPEGLPAVMTIALALGAQRMLQRRALIRKLPAVETLGSVTVICSDKTGTLTENKMTVTVVDVAGNRVDFLEELQYYSPRVSLRETKAPRIIEQPAVAMMLVGGALCNDAALEVSEDEGGGFYSVGDPTEGALVVAAARAGLWKNELEKALPRVGEIPFDSDRKRMTTLHRFEGGSFPAGLQLAGTVLTAEERQPYLSITKGAVDSLLEVSNRVWVDGRVEPLDAEWRRRIEAANAELAQKGMRVLGVSFRMCDREPGADCAKPVEEDLIFIGMMGMIDPARPEVMQAVKTAREAGVRTIMITGDHPLTALHIARDLGIAGEDGRVIAGPELVKMELDELKTVLGETSVFARVSPEHKLKIVNALQEKGQIVAMTGDGVNDAPALKKADIGVAMGITGTDVSKEASDMILLDDNFATIVAAIHEGRRIYDNIRKFIRYTLTSNAGEIWVMLIGPFIGMPLPLTPLQILWVNLVTDGLPGLALTVEPAERDTMKRPPYPPKENIFARGLARDVLWIGILMAAVSIAAGLWALNTGRAETWQTMVFTTLTIAQMGNVLAIRSQRDSLFKIGLLSNKSLLGAVILTLGLQMAVIYLPFMQRIFETTALPPLDLAVCLGLSLLFFLILELVKWLQRIGNSRRQQVEQTRPAMN
jgi:Ca2+-transporting ATPase